VSAQAKTAPSAHDVCLAVDLGTGGPKVGYVRLSGEILWQEHQLVETRWLPDGGAEQDAVQWWSLVRDAARRGLESRRVDAAEVVAVSCTGQWASTVPVDSSGNPTAGCLMWMDTRGAPWSRRVIGGPVAGYAPRPAIQWVRRSGGAPNSNGADPIGHMLYLQHGRPEVAAATTWYLEPVDYLSMRFSGKPAASHASMVAAWLTDNRRLHEMSYDPVLLRLAGIDGSKLPPLVPTGSVTGTVQPSVAAELGLPDGARVRVVTGTPDLHSAACGAGGVRDFDTHLAISTSAWIGAPVPFKKTDPLHSIVSVPGLGSGGYVIANNHETGGLCLQWLRDVAFPGASYDEVVAEAAAAPPGAGNVIFTPWLNGERSPVDDRNARGGFHNVSLATNRGALARAVLEGVALNNRWLHGAVESFAGRRLEPLRIIGGGAQSDLWCQIHADVMGRTLERVPLPLHSNLRGAAIFAGMSLGTFSPGEVAGLVGIEAVFEPDPSRRELYDRLYAEFPKLYKSQRSMFSRLNRRPGSPP
jgi:xylulokinase